jgi:hypothetical protein
MVRPALPGGLRLCAVPQILLAHPLSDRAKAIIGQRKSESWTRIAEAACRRAG